MKLTGGCYCGALRYEISGDIPMRALCLCKTCQRISGGAGNLFLGIEAKFFMYSKGAPRTFALSDDTPIREFCGDCGVHITARSPKLPEGLVVKVGTLDDPSAFEGPAAVYWASEKQDYHVFPEGIPVFASLPGR